LNDIVSISIGLTFQSVMMIIIVFLLTYFLWSPISSLSLLSTWSSS